MFNNFTKKSTKTQMLRYNSFPASYLMTISFQSDSSSQKHQSPQIQHPQKKARQEPIPRGSEQSSHHLATTLSITCPSKHRSLPRTRPKPSATVNNTAGPSPNHRPKVPFHPTPQNKKTIIHISPPALCRSTRPPSTPLHASAHQF